MYRGETVPSGQGYRRQLVEVVVPVYNEQTVLAASVRRLHDYLTESFPYDFRITIADNASTDGTWPLARDLALELEHVRAVHLEKKGRGRALRHVWSTSDADVVSYMDVDLSTGLEAFLPLVAPLLSGHSDLAIGTRLTRGSAVARGLKREVISRSYNLLLKTTLGAYFSDAQCGFKAGRTEIVRALLPSVEDDAWFFDTELLLLAESKGLRIHEVPVDWVDDLDSRVDILKTAYQDLRGMARVARRLCTQRGIAASPPARTLPRFAAIGVVSTIAHLLLYLLLRNMVSAVAANAIALLVTAVANTAANRRFTFGVTGSQNALRHQAEGGVAFLLGLGISSGGLALLPTTNRSLELAAVVACNALATVVRFVLFRGWIFRPGRQSRSRPEVALLPILGLAAFLYTWGLSANGTANSYYAAAVLSGTKSWKAFICGALDSGSFITVDKPPLALWVMGLSARIFGFGTWSLLLPQVLEGVAAVAVLYVAVRRVSGHVAGLIAALVLTLTPITVAINRDDNPDTLLVLLLVLGGWACLEAIRSGRLLPLLLSATAIGLAFNTKMMQAYLVLPAFALVYLATAPGRVWRRIGRLSLFGTVLAVVSFSWMTAIDAVPASHRPYAGSSTGNSVWNLALGYNGIGRIVGRAHEAPGRAVFGSGAGPGRLFSGQVGVQISWLIPFAVIALAGALMLRGRRPRTDLRRAALLLWGGWLLVHFAVFSFSNGIFHAYYTTAAAPAIAALTGAGGVALFRAYRHSAGWSWCLPAAIAVTGGWSVVMLVRAPGFLPWLPGTVALATAVAVGTLLLPGLRRGSPGSRRVTRLAMGATLAGVVGVLAGPAAFAVTPLTRPVQGNNPLAGPRSATRPRMPETRPLDPGLIPYLEAHRDGATWLAAVPSARLAAPMILQSHGRPVMAMGGFGGNDPALPAAKLEGYVQSGRLHYLLLDEEPRPGRPFGNPGAVAWVHAHCAAVTELPVPKLFRCD